MPPEPPEDAPRLTAWIDTDGEDDQLHIVVSEDGTEYDRLDTHISVLAVNNQVLSAFERPPLTLLTLYQRRVGEQAADVESVDPTEVSEPAE